MIQIVKKDHIYDPYWEFTDLEEERLREVSKRAINTVGPKGDGEHEEAVRIEEKSQGGILRLDQQEEKRIPKVARVRALKVKRKRKTAKWSFSDEERERRSKVMKDRWKKKREGI